MAKDPRTAFNRPGAAASPRPAPGVGVGKPYGTPPVRPNLERTLDQLGAEIDRWKLESEKFFSGGTPFPPDQLRLKISTSLRDLRNSNLKSATEQFRFATLEARFNTYSELFGRRLREREEGRRRTAAPAVAVRSRLDPLAGIVVTDRLESEAVEAIFGTLVRNGSAPANLDLDAFRTFLEKQVSGLRAKTGAVRVQLRLAPEDGKLRLKAKPVEG